MRRLSLWKTIIKYLNEKPLSIITRKELIFMLRRNGFPNNQISMDIYKNNLIKAGYLKKIGHNRDLENSLYMTIKEIPIDLTLSQCINEGTVNYNQDLNSMLINRAINTEILLSGVPYKNYDKKQKIKAKGFHEKQKIKAKGFFSKEDFKIE